MEGPMGNPKDQVQALLQKLPEDASYEDIQYHLYVLEKVQRGMLRADSEGVVDHAEAKGRLGQWLAS
jgi:hypothetical protein